VSIKTDDIGVTQGNSIRSEVQHNMSRITINLKEDEITLKNMIKDLKEADVYGNPYLARSESIVAKLILKLALEKEHAKYVKVKK